MEIHLLYLRDLFDSFLIFIFCVSFLFHSDFVLPLSSISNDSVI